MTKAKKDKGLKNLRSKQMVKPLEADSVRGGDGKGVKVTSVSFGVHKDKMISANKNADAIRSLL